MRLEMALAGALLVAVVLVLPSCATNPPRQPDDLCAVFAEKSRWYRGAKRAEKRWGLPVHVGMAFVYRESSYVADAKPPRGKLLWVIPWRRPSSAYGYAQATDDAWHDYRKATGRIFVERDNLADALDFIGWYNHRSHRKLGLPKHDAYSLYLAYYVGHGGYARGHHRKKPAAQNYAQRVARRAARYERQLAGCRKRLDRGRWLF